MAQTFSSGNIVVVITATYLVIGTYNGVTSLTDSVSGSIGNAIQLTTPGYLFLSSQMGMAINNTTDVYYTTPEGSYIYPTIYIDKIPGLDTTNTLFIPTGQIQGIYIANSAIQSVYNNFVTNFSTTLYRSEIVKVTT